MTASPSCTALPEIAKKRTYPAQVIEKSNGYVLVWVVNSTDIMVGWGNDNGFTGTRDLNTVRFDITDDIFVATFNGQYRLNYGSGPVLCAAPDHHLEVTPTGS
jgi:hypothetical protein